VYTDSTTTIHETYTNIKKQRQTDRKYTAENYTTTLQNYTKEY